jgi:hypothetical protein
MNQTIPNVRDQVAELPGKGLNRQDQLGASKAITIKEFLNTLRAVKSDQKIVFQLDKERLVAAGYHVTEVKAVIYNTMDCGGVADKWDETVVQLWNPSDEPERDDMKVGKFLAIYDQVAEHAPVSDDSELRFEYGDDHRPAIAYHVERLESKGSLILVELRAPAVTCKARDRKKAAAPTNQARCCG